MADPLKALIIGGSEEDQAGYRIALEPFPIEPIMAESLTTAESLLLQHEDLDAIIIHDDIDPNLNEIIDLVRKIRTRQPLPLLILVTNDQNQNLLELGFNQLSTSANLPFVLIEILGL